MSIELEETMADESKPESESIRIPTEALKAARLAADYLDMTLKDYLGKIIFEAANWDLEEGHREYRERVPAPAEAPRSRRPRKPKGGE
jgi:hypothetical protein